MVQVRWHVTSQSQRPAFGPGNTLIDMMDVHFVVDDTGDAGMISIPLNQYNAERVAAMVQPLADNMAAVRKLGGS